MSWSYFTLGNCRDLNIMSLALNCWFSQCYNTRIFINCKIVTILFCLLIIQLPVYNRTITRFIADDNVVYQWVRWEIRLASDNSWARHHSKHVSWRSRWIIFRVHLNREWQFHAKSKGVFIATQLNWTSWKQRTAKSVVFLFMTSRPTNWVNWVSTFIDRWQLFTLWTCRQLDVELNWVELCRYKQPLRCQSQAFQ